MTKIDKWGCRGVSSDLIGLFVYGLPLWASSVFAASVNVLVQSSPLAGSQYYAVEALWGEMRLGDRLTLVREPENRYDKRAVRIEWKGHKLGYVPRKNNRLVAESLDIGEALEARISKLRDDPDPWQRVEFEIYLAL